MQCIFEGVAPRGHFCRNTSLNATAARPAAQAQECPEAGRVTTNVKHCLITSHAEAFLPQAGLVRFNEVLTVLLALLHHARISQLPCVGAGAADLLATLAKLGATFLWLCRGSCWRLRMHDCVPHLD